jgi:hypothetical protein
VGRRAFHPLSGYTDPQASGLVPIVIEQTVRTTPISHPPIPNTFLGQG